MVKIDFSNAFNCLRRDTILEAVARHLPELLPFASSSYSRHSSLTFGEWRVTSEMGAQQGDPLGPLYFCLAVHETLSSVKSELALGYLDDFTLGGEASVVAEDFASLEASARAIGLTVNRAKCEVIGSSRASRALFASRGVDIREVDPGERFCWARRCFWGRRLMRQ